MSIAPRVDVEPARRYREALLEAARKIRRGREPALEADRGQCFSPGVGRGGESHHGQGLLKPQLLQEVTKGHPDHRLKYTVKAERREHRGAGYFRKP